MKLIVGSDFHGNEEATRVFCEYVRSFNISEVVVVLAGDYINYGPRSSSVVALLRSLESEYKTVKIRGNHEDALFKEADRQKFSSQRGQDALDITKSLLSTEDLEWLLDPPDFESFMVEGYSRPILVIHGIHDNKWVAMNEEIQEDEIYGSYDLVLSGHSHKSRMSYNDVTDTVFVNPGSVGQDRSGNGGAHWATIDLQSRAVQFIRREYDVEKEISKYAGLGYHEYYQTRLRVGK